MLRFQNAQPKLVIFLQTDSICTLGTYRFSEKKIEFFFFFFGALRTALQLPVTPLQHGLLPKSFDGTLHCRPHQNDYAGCHRTRSRLAPAKPAP